MKTNLHWLIAAGTALSLGSCTTKNQSSYLEIEGLVAPTTAESLDAGSSIVCTYSATASESSPETFNDARDFTIGVVVVNNLTNNADTAIGRINTNDFIVTQAVTTFEATNGSVINIPQQITPAQGVVAAGDTSVIPATLIPAAIAAQLEPILCPGATCAAIRLHTHLEGRLLDGSSVSTNEYLPVAVPTTSNTDTSSCTSSGG